MQLHKLCSTERWYYYDYETPLTTEIINYEFVMLAYESLIIEEPCAFCDHNRYKIVLALPCFR